MENKITGIYNNGTVRVERLMKPVELRVGYTLGMSPSQIKDLSDKRELYEALESANIAEADKPYWEIEVEMQSRSWEEHYKHENGMYLNTCRWCLKRFMGHKRTVACKLCATLTNNTQVQFYLENNKAVIV